MRQRRRRRFEPEPVPAAETREVLSYEVSRSHGLWHCDMHHGKRRVLTPSGEWKTPILLGFLDDHSRVPDRAARVLLTVIDRDPESVVRALAPEESGTGKAHASAIREAR